MCNYPYGHYPDPHCHAGPYPIGHCPYRNPFINECCDDCVRLYDGNPFNDFPHSAYGPIPYTYPYPSANGFNKISACNHYNNCCFY